MQDEGMRHEAHWWKLVEEFVTNCNAYCIQLFYPSDIICTDDSISKWYGQGDHWINLGLPTYMAMERNMDNGAEIHNAVCWHLEIMMQLKIIKSARHEE